MKSVVLAGAMVAGLFAADASAQQNLVGTWKVSGSNVGVGQSMHPHHSVEGDKPRFYRADLTFTVEAQDGPVFYGSIKGPQGSTDRFVGSINSAGQGMVVNDRGGVHHLTVVSPDKLQSLYTLGSKTYVTSGLLTWERQPK